MRTRLDAVPVGWFVLRNTGLGGVLGFAIAVVWAMAVSQGWFVPQIIVLGAFMSAIYGAVGSLTGLMIARLCRRLWLAAVGLVFGCTTIALQVGLILAIGRGWILNLIVPAFAYSALGAVLSVLILRWRLRAPESTP